MSAVASISRVRKKCGTVVQLCVVRSAMSRPMDDSFSSAPAAALLRRRMAPAARCQRSGVGSPAAARMSAARISPSGPEPRNVAMSTLCSLARRRALGEMRTRAGGHRGGAEAVAAFADCAETPKRKTPRGARRRRRFRERFARRGGFAGREQPGDRLADGNHVAGLRRHAAENAVGEGFDFDDGFVRLDLEQNFAFGDAIRLLFCARRPACQCPAPFPVRA